MDVAPLRFDALLPAEMAAKAELMVGIGYWFIYIRKVERRSAAA